MDGRPHINAPTGRRQGVTPLELAERALGFCDGPAQVTVWRERWLVSRFARSAPTQATAVEDTQVHVLALHQRHLEAAQTTRADHSTLAETWRRALAAARAAAAGGGPGDYPGLPDPVPITAAAGHDPA